MHNILTEQQELYMHLRVVSTLLVNTPTITVDLYSPEPLTKA